MPSSEIIIIVLVELCVILAAVSVIVTLLLRKARNQLDELRASLKLRKDESADFERLIARELQRTQHRMQTLLSRDKPDDEAIIATRLRAKFLTAEKHARGYRENQEEFWRALEGALKDMIALSRLKIAQTTGSEREIWQKKLDSSEQQVNELELLRGNYSASADAMRKAQDQTRELLDLRELKEQHVAKIEQLVQQIAQLRTASSRVELPPAQGSDDEIPTNAIAPVVAPVIVRNVQEVQYMQSAIADTLHQIESFQSNSSSEVKLLKDMCLEQRALIKKLREKLKLESAENGESALDTDVQSDSLQRLLRDSEMCVQTLEQEIENLQGEIVALRDQLRGSLDTLAKITMESPESPPDAQSEARIEQFREQNQRLRERIREHEQQHRISQQIRGFIAGSSDCNSANAVIELLASAMNQFGVQGNIQIRSGAKTLSAGVGGGIDSKDANVLNSILLGQAVTAVGDDTILALPPLKLLVKGGSGVRPASINMASIREIAEAFSRQLANLEQGEQRRDQYSGKSQTFGTIKKSLANIKVQWGYQETEARQVTKNLVEDLSIALSTTDIGEPEERRLLVIIEESAKRLDVLFNSGKVIDKSIAQLLQKIDEAAP